MSRAEEILFQISEVGATPITHANFDQVMAEVEKGKKAILIASQTRPMMVRKKEILKFRKAGFEVLTKDQDGKGFRLQSGKSRLYILPSQIFSQDL